MFKLRRRYINSYNFFLYAFCLSKNFLNKGIQLKLKVFMFLFVIVRHEINLIVIMLLMKQNCSNQQKCISSWPQSTLHFILIYEGKWHSKINFQNSVFFFLFISNFMYWVLLTFKWSFSLIICSIIVLYSSLVNELLGVMLCFAIYIFACFFHWDKFIWITRIVNSFLFTAIVP